MEIIEVTKELFENNHVRILGTFEEPLFVANDIGAVLEIKKISEGLRDYDDTEKVLNTIQTPGGNQQMTLLTEKGLYRLLYASRKPLAKKFQNWVYHVLHDVRTKGKYELQKAIEDNKKELELRDLKIKELETKTVVNYHQPIVNDTTIDVNEFVGKSVVYLLHVTDSDYKFGVTSDADSRIIAHKHYFKKLGYDITVVKMWKCESANIMSVIEGMIKTYAKQNNILARKYDLTEIITINNTINIETIINKITDYVNNRNVTDERGYELELLKIKLEFLKEENRGKELDNRGKELDNEKIRLNSELAICERCICKQNNSPIEMPPVVDNQNDIQDNIEYEDVDMVKMFEVEQFPENIILMEKEINITVKKSKEAKTAKQEKEFVKQATANWISLNLPVDGELTTVYYKRYMDNYNGVKIGRADFTRFVKSHNYFKRIKHGGTEYWAKFN
ncbi:hypothetical protein PV-S19_0022 [Pacmanvirus S19]|nr:hypothetical protein PV-S19_0022 [Pacmanvirus S19]